MVVGFQETRFRTQWHCYYTRQVRRIPVSIPRSSSGYSYQYLYLYNIKPAEVISGTSCLSDSVYPCRISHICIRSPSLYHSKFHISKPITKKNQARKAQNKKEEPLPTHHVHQSNPLPLPQPPNKPHPHPHHNPQTQPLPRTTSSSASAFMKALSFHWELIFFFKASGLRIMKMESQGEILRRVAEKFEKGGFGDEMGSFECWGGLRRAHKILERER